MKHATSLGGTDGSGTRASATTPYELEELVTSSTRPPSYCPADPAYLESDDKRHVRFETRRSIPVKQSQEPQQLDWSKLSKARRGLVAKAYWGLPGLARFTLSVLPFVSMFVLASRYIFSGDDVLGLSADSFILVAANVGVLTLIALFLDSMTGSRYGTRLELAHHEAIELAALAFMWLLSLLWAVSGLILWGVFAAGEGSIAERWVLATQFDAKISQQNALGFVTSCLSEMIPERNAAIYDLTVCFQKLDSTKGSFDHRDLWLANVSFAHIMVRKEVLNMLLDFAGPFPGIPRSNVAYTILTPNPTAQPKGPVAEPLHLATQRSGLIISSVVDVYMQFQSRHRFLFDIIPLKQLYKLLTGDFDLSPSQLAGQQWVQANEDGIDT
ncbi:NPS5 [Fusarium coicis]|nr:NPS5 [Fusarium coicis]